MNLPTIPDRSPVFRVILALMIALVVLGGVAMGVLIFQVTSSTNRLVHRVEDCIDPEGACAQEAARTRAQFADVLNLERHQDLAAAIVCARNYPRADIPTIRLCIARAEVPGAVRPTS